MSPGQEKSHLRSLLRSASYRGTGVRFQTEVDDSMHEVPYLAMRWQWKTVLAFPWRQQGHINELEMNAYCYPLWTISAWNFADKPSRMYEKKA